MLSIYFKTKGTFAIFSALISANSALSAFTDEKYFQHVLEIYYWLKVYQILVFANG